ncbi:MFS transporter [soil metagenome]
MGRHPLRRRLPRARVAVATGFFLSGMGVASWVVRIPAVREGLALSEGVLGLTLVGISVGALLAMPLSGALIARFGSRPVARAAMLGYAAALMLPPQATSRLLLTLALLVMGAASSFMNVALNTQATAVERRMRRPVMAGLHAMFSVGGLIGAGIGGAIAGAGVDPRWHLAGAGVVIAALSLLVTTALLRPGTDGAMGGPAFAVPTRPLLLLGAVAFCVLVGEGAVADWSAIYLRDIAGAGPGLAAAGFAAFSLMMAAGRFAGDALTVRFGPARLVRASAATAAAGVVLAIAWPAPWAAVAGFGAVGAGLSVVFPTLVAAAGRLPGVNPSMAIATISWIGYTGFLAGPPLIGFAAEAISLRGGIALVGITSLMIVALAGTLSRTPVFASREARRALHGPLSGRYAPEA